MLSGLEARQRLADSMGAALLHDLQADGLPQAQAETQVARSQARICQAPLGILLCLDTRVGDQYPDARRQQAEDWMGVQSVALAGGALLLAAHAEGLGGVWICSPLFATAAASQALDLPENWLPQALILLGYPAQPSQAGDSSTVRSRLSVDQISRFY